MAGGGKTKSTNAPRIRKRVEVDSESEVEIEIDADTTSTKPSVKRAKDGSAFVRCDKCKKSVAIALIKMHDCSFDENIRLHLEAQVVEVAAEGKEVKKKAVHKRKPSANTGKKSKDPNKPKRPPTAFFVFMDEFRKTFKEANPDNNKVSVVAKEGGVKWKSLSDEEKKPYLDKAAELKAEYETALATPVDEVEEVTPIDEVEADEEASAEDKQADAEEATDDE